MQKQLENSFTGQGQRIMSVLEAHQLGNQGRRYDEAMGIKLDTPRDANLPGINGKFYDELLDDVMRKYGEALKKMTFSNT